MMNNFLDIKIQKRNSKLNNLVLYENINNNYLDLLINSNLLISDDGKWNHKIQLQKYKSNYNNDNGLNKVIYKSSDINYGRVQAKNCIGLHMIMRKFRNTLCNNKYIDCDIYNCHPVILEQILINNNIKCDKLSYYVKNRDTVLNNIMNTYNIDRDLSKTLLIKIINGGTYNSFIKKYKLNNEKIEFINEFEKETLKYQEIIKNNNEDLLNEIKIKYNNDKNIYNINGKVISYFLQEKECQILESIYDYCNDNNLINNNNIILCSDGLMLFKENIKDVNINDLLLNIEKYINDKLNIKISLIEKPMNDVYTLDELYQHSTFENIKNINDEINDIININKNLTENINNNNNINDITQLNKNMKHIFKLTKKRELLIENNLKKFNKDFKKIDNIIEIKDDFIINNNEINYFNKKYMKSLKSYYEKKIYFENFVCKILTPNVCYIFTQNKTYDLGKEQVLFKQKELIECFYEIKSGIFMNNKELSFTDVWLKDEDLLSYNTLDFIPYNKEFDNKNNLIYNLFNGYNEFINTNIDNINKDKKLKPFFDLGLELCNGNNEYFNFFIKFIAHMIQKPNEKMPICFILKGNQGTGKNVFLDCIGNIINKDYYITSSNPKDFFGDYAEGFYRKLLVNMNEVEQKDTFDFEGKIKSFITEDTITLNAKFLRQTKIRNIARVIITTNKPNPIPVDIKSKDRRYVIYQTTDKYLDKKYNTKFWINLINHFKSSEFIACLYDYLNNINIDNYDFRTNRPITEAYIQMCQLYYPTEALFISDHINNDKIKNIDDINNYKVDNQGLINKFQKALLDDNNNIIGEIVKVSYLYNLYIDYSKRNGFTNDKSYSTSISKFINKMNDLKIPIITLNIGGAKYFKYNYIDLLNSLKQNNLIDRDDNDCFIDEDLENNENILDNEFNDYFN